ncbi:hypothetical protein M569_02524 [Genlisea aurea]|uniref:Peptidyl-prolyl cis-trans isomerase n=1 Tax=Genlisea aurea TaxID=192259 RepID=S8EHQ4_9LAMI|nr:hypothetical protein M569_02524 [Genlisea aurea]
MGRIKPQTLLQQSKRKKGPNRISITTFSVYALIVVVLGLLVFTSYTHWIQRSKFDASSGVKHDDSSSVDDNTKKLAAPKYAVIKTSKGSITVELFREGSPEVVAAFIQSSLKGSFKGMLFNLVIKNFMIQGSDTDRPGGSAVDWTSIGKNNQLDTSLKHEAFMVGTSKDKVDSSGFDLIITTAPIPDLNGKISVFGRVVKGEDVVQEIEEADTDEHFRPKSPIAIIEVMLKLRLRGSGM